MLLKNCTLLSNRCFKTRGSTNIHLHTIILQIVRNWKILQYTGNIQNISLLTGDLIGHLYTSGGSSRCKIKYTPNKCIYFYSYQYRTEYQLLVGLIYLVPEVHKSQEQHCKSRFKYHAEYLLSPSIKLIDLRDLCQKCQPNSFKKYPVDPSRAGASRRFLNKFLPREVSLLRQPFVRRSDPIYRRKIRINFLSKLALDSRPVVEQEQDNEHQHSDRKILLLNVNKRHFIVTQHFNFGSICCVLRSNATIDTFYGRDKVLSYKFNLFYFLQKCSFRSSFVELE